MSPSWSDVIVPVPERFARECTSQEDCRLWLPRCKLEQTDTPKLRLFGFPFAGGGASVLHRWMAPLADLAEIYAVQPPGREERRGETAYRTIFPLIAAMEAALAPLIADRPSVFFGHSMGALLAYELAAQLHQAGHPGPIHLILSGMAPPHVIDRVPPLHRLPRDRVITALDQMGGTPKTVLNDPELMDMVLPVICTDIALVYSRKRSGNPAIPVPITTFAGEHDPLAPAKDVRQWQNYGSADFAERIFPGGHFFINDSSRDVLGVMRAILRRAGRDG